MRRTATLAWGLLLACATSALAQVDGLELSGPTDLLPPAAEALPEADLPAPAPAPAPSPSPKPAPPNRPTLIRPRLRTSPPLSLPPLAEPGPDDDLPALIGPAEMIGPAAAQPRGPGATARGPRPLTLETVPRDEVEFGPARPATAPARSPAPGEILPGRRPRTGGRAATATASAPAGDRAKGDPTAKDAPEPTADPAADAALKRRVEREVREAVGDRLRSLEVLVVNRRVVVQASATRFWQRRTLRRSIETLPVLAGTRATVHVDD